MTSALVDENGATSLAWPACFDNRSVNAPRKPPNYLAGYPANLLAQVQPLITAGTLGEHVRRRYPQAHVVRTDRALYEYVSELKSRHLRSAEPLAKVAYEPRLQLVHQALGTHTTVARVQGGKLKAKREIRVASLFKDAPAEFLRMIVVHELAHLREREHDKAFYSLCCHMEPAYHQLEFDTRLWLTALALEGPSSPGASPAGSTGEPVDAH
jgi:predicted metal-dependent hydrolase